MNRRHIKYIAIILAAFGGLFAGIPVEFGSEGNFFHGFMIPKPVISIGIGINLKELKITASSGMKVYEVGAVYNSLANDTQEAMVKSGGGKITEKFIILLANTNNRKEAETRASEFNGKVAGNIFIEEENESGAGVVFSVKLGDFMTRGEALAKIRELNANGINDVWIEREEVPESGRKPFWLITDGRLQTLPDNSVLYFIPSNPQSLLSNNGRAYRGIFILKNSRRGLTLVNVVNLEDYLKGVVPGELSPSEFPAIEALKAQAVAARTYALKNMGQFQDSGFDLIHTPRSQVYLGVQAEHPLSNRAVEETRGEVMLYKGELINALYTSTCGGKTEDAEYVFSGPPVPYLQSVDCSYEKQPEYHVVAERPALPVILGDYDASFETSLAVSLAIVQLGAETLDFKAPVVPAELDEWIHNTQKLLGLKEIEITVEGDTIDYYQMARLLVTAFGWEERVSRLVLPSEVQFISKGWPQTDVKSRNALAYCLQAGLLPIFDRTDAAAPTHRVSKAEAAVSLSKLAVSQQDFFESGTLSSAGRDSIEVGFDREKKSVPLSRRVFLLRNSDGRSTFASHLTLLGGEKIRWIERDGRISLLEVMYPPVSDTLDRFSRFSRWQVVKSREEMEKRLSQRYQIGKLIDITARKRGASGRVTELVVTGSEQTVRIRGLQVRNVLSLRDMLFVIDKAYTETGAVSRFTFSGRGWGHGVGLCQVGAYGMAVAGTKYQDILKKYYKGIKVVKRNN